MKPMEWLKLTIEEAVPVICHAELAGCRLDPGIHRAGAAHPGPFYAPGSAWYYRADERRHAELVAEGRRREGYTVTVTTEMR